MYPGTHLEPHENIRSLVQDIERIWLHTSSGRVEAWYLPPEKKSDRPSPVVIFAHGNGELIDYRPGEFSDFTQAGIGVLLVEYPGYGRSEGSPSEKSITEAFVTAYDTIAARSDVDTGKIILFGRSLGGGAVCALTARRPCAALILQSTFTTIRSFAARFLVPAFIVRDPFDNLSVVKSFTNPVLVIHGKYDDIIPYEQGAALYKAAQKGQMISYDCGHNDCPPDRDIFWQDVQSFLVKSGIIKRKENQDS
jgi:pimeloyl-ACP methyl ester carboxylesterase